MVNQFLVSGALFALVAVVGLIYFLSKLRVHQQLQRFMDDSEELLQKALAVAALDDADAQKVLTSAEALFNRVLAYLKDKLPGSDVNFVIRHPGLTYTTTKPWVIHRLKEARRCLAEIQKHHHHRI